MSSTSPSVSGGDIEKTTSDVLTNESEDFGAVSQPPPIEIPDGGRQAWLTLLGGWMITFVTFGATNAFGVYQDYYTLAETATAANIGWIGSLQLFFMFAIGLPTGKLFDEGYFHHTQAAGSLLYVFSLFMLSLADPTKYYQIILSQGVGVGIALGLLLIPAYSIQAHHWKRNRALAMGIVSTGTSIGGIVYSIMLNRLFNGSAGFAWGVRASAFLTMGLLLIANSIMTTRLPSAKKRPPGPKPDIGSIVSDWPFMLLVIGGFLVFFGLFFPYFYLQLYVNLHGFPSNFAFYTIAIINGGSIPGRLLPNILADRLGHLNFICPLCVICGALLFAMLNLPHTASIVIFSLFYGFFSGAFISLLSPLIAVFAKDMHELGIRMGIGYFICSFALLGGGPTYGALLNPGLHWSRPIIFSSIMMLVGSVAMFLSRQGLSARVGSQHV